MKKYLIFALFLYSLAACQSGNERTRLTTEISNLQQEIGKESRPSSEHLHQLKSALLRYSETYPDDSLSLEFLIKAGEVAGLLQQFDEAIHIYDRITARYPGSPKSAKALFMKGFTYENNLQNLDSARMAYQLFLEKYPGDSFAKDAKFLLDNLGKTPEEILKGLESQ